MYIYIYIYIYINFIFFKKNQLKLNVPFENPSFWYNLTISFFIKNYLNQFKL